MNNSIIILFYCKKNTLYLKWHANSSYMLCLAAKQMSIYISIQDKLVSLTCCGRNPWGRCGWFCQSWRIQTPSQWENNPHPAQQRRGPCAPWLASPDTSCHTCTDCREDTREHMTESPPSTQRTHVIHPLVVLIRSCEVIGFHGVPAQCVAPHRHYHLQEHTDDKSPSRLRHNTMSFQQLPF